MDSAKAPRRTAWFGHWLCALAAAALGLIAAALPAATAVGRSPPVRVAITGNVMRISGTVPNNLSPALATILDRFPQVRTVLLDSPGGTMIGALSTATLIRARGLNTMVPFNSECASACVILLAGGVERRVAPGTRVGIHHWKYAQPPPEAIRERDTAGLRKAFADFGVSEQIVDMMLAVPNNTIRWLTRSEMRHLNLITAKVAGP